MFGYLPVKNLYLVELLTISNIMYDGFVKTTYFDNNIIYAIVRKEGHICPDYTDVFSGTTYNHWKDVSEKGVIVVKKEIPIMTISKYIKKSDLQRLLIEKNNICYDEKIVKKLTK